MKKRFLPFLLALLFVIPACESDEKTTKEDAIGAAIEAPMNVFSDETITILEDMDTPASFPYSYNTNINYNNGGLSLAGTISLEMIQGESNTCSFDGTVTTAFSSFKAEGVVLTGSITETFSCDMVLDSTWQNVTSAVFSLSINGTIYITGDETGTIVFDNVTATMDENENMVFSGSLTFNGEPVPLDSLELE